MSLFSRFVSFRLVFYFYFYFIFSVYLLLFLLPGTHSCLALETACWRTGVVAFCTRGRRPAIDEWSPIDKTPCQWTDRLRSRFRLGNQPPLPHLLLLHLLRSNDVHLLEPLAVNFDRFE